MPNDTLIFDGSTLDEWACEARGVYRNLMHLELKGYKHALVRGTVGHAGLEVYFKERQLSSSHEVAKTRGLVAAAATWPDDWEDLLDGRTGLVKVGKDQTGEALEVVIDAQKGKWQPEDILAVEESASIFLDKETMYVGNVDLMVRSGGAVPWDHKFTSMLPGDRYADLFEFDPKMIGYVVLARQIMPEIPINSYTINAIHIRETKTKGRDIIPQTYSYHVNDKAVERWYALTRQKIADIRAVMAGTRPPAMEKACCYQYGTRCQYFDLCKSGVSERTLAPFELTRWDPLLRKVVPITQEEDE